MKLFHIFIIVFFALVGYVGYRGWQSLVVFSPAVKITYIAVFALCFLTMMSGFLFADVLPVKIAASLSFLGYTFLMFVIYMAMAFLLIDIIRIFVYIFANADAEIMFRFRLWAGAVAFVSVCVLLAWGNYNFNNPKVVEISIASSKPKQGKQLKIVGLSDMHIGSSIGKKKVQKYVELINAQSPDIVLFAGDITDRGIKPIISQNIHEDFQKIKSNYGVFAAVGNHEKYSSNKELTLEYLKKSGIRLLIDESALIDSSFYLVGRDDKTNHDRKDLPELVENLNKDLPVILLDHQPFNLENAEQNGVDFQFSGHTHNGQFFPGNFIVKIMYELSYGYKKKGGTHYYVSSGVGIWGPQYRIGTQSEILVVNLEY
jgi:predicted MPP superfamily phosphohydrolase